MCSYAILVSVVFLPVVSLGLIYAEQEFSSAVNQKRQFKREMAELEKAISSVRSKYDGF